MHRLNALHERILEDAEVVGCTPHQALHDAGHPHRGDVKQDAKRRGPEVPLDQPLRIEALPLPQPRNEAVEGAHGDHADPAEST